MSILAVYSKQVFQDNEPLSLQQSKSLIQEARHCLKAKELLGEIQSDYLDLLELTMCHAGLTKEKSYKDMQVLRRKVIAWFDSQSTQDKGVSDALGGI